MMGIINGIERTPAQLKKIVESAGLVIEKVWECRAQVPIVEVRLGGWDEGKGPNGTVVNGLVMNGLRTD